MKRALKQTVASSSDRGPSRGSMIDSPWKHAGSVAPAKRGALELEVKFPSTMIKLLNLTHHRPFGFTKGD